MRLLFLLLLLAASPALGQSFGVSPTEIIFLDNESVKQLNIISTEPGLSFRIDSDAPLEFMPAKGKLNGMQRVIVKRLEAEFDSTITVEVFKESGSPLTLSSSIKVHASGHEEKPYHLIPLLAAILVAAAFAIKKFYV